MKDNMVIIKKVPIQKNTKISNEDVIRFINGRDNVLGELGLINCTQHNYLDIIDLNRYCTVKLSNVSHRILSVYEDENKNLFMDIELQPLHYDMIMNWIKKPDDWDVYGIVRAVINIDSDDISIVTIDISANGLKPEIIF